MKAEKSQRPDTADDPTTSSIERFRKATEALTGPLNQNERISLRVDEKLKFALEFACDVTGHSQKKLVQNALDKAMKEARLPNGKNWLDYWDPDPGVRKLKLLYAPDYPSTAEDDLLRVFIDEHKPFFFFDEKPRRDYLAIFWPRIDKYVTMWRENRMNEPNKVWLELQRLADDFGLPHLESNAPRF